MLVYDSRCSNFTTVSLSTSLIPSNSAIWLAIADILTIVRRTPLLRRRDARPAVPSSLINLSARQSVCLVQRLLNVPGKLCRTHRPDAYTVRCYEIERNLRVVQMNWRTTDHSEPLLLH